MTSSQCVNSSSSSTLEDLFRHFKSIFVLDFSFFLSFFVFCCYCCCCCLFGRISREKKNETFSGFSQPNSYLIVHDLFAVTAARQLTSALHAHAHTYIYLFSSCAFFFPILTSWKTKDKEIAKEEKKKNRCSNSFLLS